MARGLAGSPQPVPAKSTDWLFEGIPDREMAAERKTGGIDSPAKIKGRPWHSAAAEQALAEGRFQMGQALIGDKVQERNYAEAVRLFRMAAEKGHVVAQFRMGMLVAGYPGVEADPEEAVKWLRAAGRQGYVEAQVELGELLSQQRSGIQLDYDESERWFTLAARQGNEKALEKVEWCKAVRGVMAQYGCTFAEAVPQQYARMYLAQVRVLAEMWGQIEDQFELASLLDKRVPRFRRPPTDRASAPADPPFDDDEAEKWYRKAAAGGHSWAQYRLGMLLGDRRRTAEEAAEGVKWLRQAAEQGHAPAQNRLGALFLEGKDVPKDEAEALRWIRRAVDGGGMGAQFALGTLYAEGRAGLPKDPNEAHQWFELAADQGVDWIWWEFGQRLAKGDGVPKDGMQAAKWLLLATRHGEYATRRGSLKDILSAEELTTGEEMMRNFRYADDYQIADQSSLPQERYHRAAMTHMADRGDARIRMALGGSDNIARAAEQGWARAQIALAWDNGFDGHGKQKDAAAAAKWYRLPAEQGWHEAMLELGILYLTGRGVPKDHEEAMKWLIRAADMGASGSAAYYIAREWLKSRDKAMADAKVGKPEAAPGPFARMDMEQARRLQKAARIFGAYSSWALGRMHEEGIVFPEDKVEALKYYLLERSRDRPVNGIDPQIAQARARLTPEQQAEAEKRCREEMESRKAARRKAKVENGGVAYDGHLNLFP